jgi:N-acetylneuraminate synthase/N,N'-diacetyllegionaminate synthase
LVAARDISAGATLKRDMVVMRRPGTGMSPAMLDTLLDRQAKRDIAAGTLLDADMFDQD